MAKEETLGQKTERQLWNIANSHLSEEAKQGTMNPVYLADTLSSFAKNKITRFMVQHYIKHGTKNIPMLIATIRNYAADKNIDLKGISFDEESTGLMNNIMVLQVKLEGTTYYKHIKQVHVDRYLLELNQLTANAQ